MFTIIYSNLLTYLLVVNDIFCYNDVMTKGRQFLTLKEVSELLNVHPLTTRKLIIDGKLEAIKLGRAYRISKKALDEFIQKQSTKRKKK